MWKRLAETAVTLLFPSVCEICDDAPAEDGVCAGCRRAIRWLEPPFCRYCGRHAAESCVQNCRPDLSSPVDRALACAVYDAPARRLVRRFKYDGRRSLARYLGGRLGEFALAHLPAGAIDAAVAVPIDAAVRRERGYNQAELLAASAAQALGVPLLRRALFRKNGGPSQSTLARRERLTNVIGRFRADARAGVSGARLLLVDDVLTTGRTAAECARALKSAGAVSVTALAFARGA